MEVGKKYRHCNGSVLFKCIAVFDDGDVVFVNESGEKFVSPSGEAHLYVQVVPLPKPMEFYALLDRNDEWVGKTSREDGTGGRNRHLDGNPLNNRPANLTWGTPAEERASR